jgi:hypothetical protein
MQRGERGVVYAVHAEELKRRELGQPVQLSSAREAAKIGSERLKLKNLHCIEAVARERLMKTRKIGKSLAGAVVICKLWSLVVALQLLVVLSRV